MSLDFCTYEDRSEDAIAQKLLVLSLQAANASVRLHVPAIRISDSHRHWLERQPNVAMINDLSNPPTGWDIKPYLIGHLHKSGIGRVTWIDSDIIVTRDPLTLLDGVSDSTLVVSEEGFRADNVGTVCRARALDLPIGRELGWDVCTAFLSTTPHNSVLLEAWSDMMKRDDYILAQKMINSPFHISSDQELLSGLLGSAPFADVAVKRLASGRAIAHCQAPHFYPLGARLRTLRHGEPTLVHSQAAKPWREGFVKSRSPIKRPISLYEDFAQQYASALRDDPDGAFLRPARRTPWRPSLRRLDEGFWGSTRLALGKLKRLAGIQTVLPEPRLKTAVKDST